VPVNIDNEPQLWHRDGFAIMLQSDQGSAGFSSIQFLVNSRVLESNLSLDHSSI
jgi:hypothetical protein